jgi:hypothetical protein
MTCHNQPVRRPVTRKIPSPEPEDWQVRLAAAIAVHKRRRRLREQARAAETAGRPYGLERRHQQKLRRGRDGDTTSKGEQK